MVTASLPLGSKTSIEAKVVVQHLASEFVTSEADAVSKAQGDRCITSGQFIQAFENLGLGKYAASLGTLAAQNSCAPPTAVKRVAAAQKPAAFTSLRSLAKNAAYAFHKPIVKRVAIEEGGGAKKHHRRRMASDYSTDASFVTSSGYEPNSCEVPSPSRRLSQNSALSLSAQLRLEESNALAEAAVDGLDMLLGLESFFLDFITSPDTAEVSVG
ncbi:hypothetical protein T492DRAFT_846385 [Pavlovales sp. CCMP2436]|nr:hypothetical protein T492DRAFT_846385 [Pavlovales sp. CCMP2436]